MWGMWNQAAQVIGVDNYGIAPVARTTIKRGQVVSETQVQPRLLGAEAS